MTARAPDPHPTNPQTLPSIEPVYFKGRSMRGVFRPGDRLGVEPCLAEEVKVGDLLVFSQGDRVIVHRVVGRRDSQLLTWGDSNPVADEDPVAAKQIRGRVLTRNRFGRESRVKGGPQGLRAFRRHQLWWQGIYFINRTLNRLLSPGSLAWLYRIDPQLLRLADPLEWKIIHKNKSIGRFTPDTGAFQIHKPWYYFVSRTFIHTHLVVRPSKSDPI